MSDNKPPIYGFCPAGCKWETVHKSDFEKAANYYPIVIDENGTATATDIIAKYKIEAEKITEERVKKNDLPENMAGACAAAVGDSVYIFGGEIGAASPVTSIYKYTPATNAIETMTATNSYAPTDMCCAAIGTDIYLFGGRMVTALYSTKIYKYDTLTDTLSELTATLPVGLSKSACAAYGNIIYIFGGKTKTAAVDTIYKFDVLTGAVTTVSATLPNLNHSACAATVGDKIYIMGGTNYSGALEQYIKIFDCEAETIATTTIQLLCTSASCAALGNKIYLFGKFSLGRIYVYDTATGVVAESSKYLANLAAYTAAAALGNTIYIFGGVNDSSSTYYSDIQAYNDNTYDCRIRLNINNDEYEIPVTAYDKYRDYFVFEIVGYFGQSIAYEFNGVRNCLRLIRSPGTAYSGTLEIIDAVAVGYFNPDAQIGAMINGVNTLTIEAGDGIAITQDGNKLTISLATN